MSAKRDRAWDQVPAKWRRRIVRWMREYITDRSSDDPRRNPEMADEIEAYRAAIRVLERAANGKPATARARGK